MPRNIDLFLGGHLIKFPELLLLEVVVSCGDCHDDDNSDKDGGTLQPALGQAFGGDTQNQRDGSGSAQDP